MPTLFEYSGGSARYTGGTGTALSFSYTVGAGQDTGDLTVTSFNLNGATLQDAAGNSANLSGAVTNPAGTLQIDTLAPPVKIGRAHVCRPDSYGTRVPHSARKHSRSGN